MALKSQRFNNLPTRQANSIGLSSGPTGVSMSGAKARTNEQPMPVPFWRCWKQEIKPC